MSSTFISIVSRDSEWTTTDIHQSLETEFSEFQDHFFLSSSIEFVLKQICEFSGDERQILVDEIIDIIRLASEAIVSFLLIEHRVRLFVDDIGDTENYTQWEDFFHCVWLVSRKK